MNPYKELSDLLFHSSTWDRSEVTHIDLFRKRNYRFRECGIHVRGPQCDSREILRADEQSRRLKDPSWCHEMSCSHCRFLNLYGHTVGYKMRCLLERTNEFAGPILVDIDLKSTEKKQLYTEEEVLTLARLFQKVIRDNVNTELTPEMLDCYFLEKPGYFKDDNTYKNGFHLHFPNIWLSQIDRQRINDLVKPNTNFVLDDAIIRGNWFMYGSGKIIGGSYTVSYVIEEKRDKVPCTKSFMELVWLLSVIPRRTTIVSKLAFDKSVTTTSILKSFKPGTTFGRANEVGNKTYEELKHYVDQLDECRSDDYMSWRSIGCAIFNEIGNKEDGRKLWHEFSQKCPLKYNEHNCDAFWDRLTETNSTLGTIIYYCKQDNGEVLKYKPKNTEEYIDVIKEYILPNFPPVCDLTIEELEILVCTMRREPWTCYMNQVKNMFVYTDDPSDVDDYDHLLSINIVKSKHNMKKVVDIFRKYVQDNIEVYTSVKNQESWNAKVLRSIKRSKKEHMLLRNVEYEHDSDNDEPEDELNEIEKYEQAAYE